MIESILEAIDASRFASVALVAPGEATVACARAVDEEGLTVLTNNCDLMLLCSNRGTVCFLHDLDWSEENECKDCISANFAKGVIYRPGRIAAQLQVPNIQVLAYELVQGKAPPSVNPLIQRAAARPENDTELATFVENNTLQPASWQDNKQMEYLTLCNLSGHLFPPVAQLVAQIACPSRVGAVTIHLPMMIEDPTQDSAWAASRSMRRLAYEALGPFMDPEIFGEGPPSITEHVCSAGSFTDEEIILRDKRFEDELVNREREFILRAYGICERAGRFQPSSIWRLIATAEVYVSYEMTFIFEDVPSWDECMYAMLGGPRLRASWRVMHIRAQIEGVLYSWAMLKQILRYRAVLLKAEQKTAYRRLTEIMNSFPALSEVIPSEAILNGSILQTDVPIALACLRAIAFWGPEP